MGNPGIQQQGKKERTREKKNLRAGDVGSFPRNSHNSDEM